jgi:diguanylate cyclase
VGLGGSVSADHDKERAQVLARDALVWLAEYDIAPLPEHFTVAYSYLSAEHPGLRRSLEEIVAANGKLDATLVSILYHRYFGMFPHDEIITDMGEKISAELDSVLHMLEGASREHSAFGRTLSKASGDLGQGNLPDTVLKSMVDHVITATRTMEARTRSLEIQLQSSSREVSDLRERLELVRRESLTDQLTGILNRKAFDTELSQGIERAIESGEPLSLMMCDIDHFKSFNDTWGHQTGDQVLRLVATCLSENVKGRDTAARYGGEEFAVILPQTSLSDAFGLADQIRRTVESKKLVKRSTGDILGVITISMGVAEYDPNDTAAEFVRRADACLYAAKRAGRNRVMTEPDNSKLAAADTEAA